MDTYQIDRKSKEALDQAQEIQKEVSEKEMRMNLSQNVFYTFQQRSYLDDINDKYEIQMLELIKDRRDIYISSAIYYALHAIELDINRPNKNMSGALSILPLLKISSFIVYQVKSFKIDDATKYLAYQIMRQIMFKNEYSRLQHELREILNAANR